VTGPGEPTTFTPSTSPGLHLWRATLAWQRRVTAALAPLGLTHVQFVLLAVTWWANTHDERPTQAEVADRAATDVKMTSEVLRGLEKAGLLDRGADPRDARVRRLQVTARGADLAPRAIAVVEAVDLDFFAAVDTDRAVGLLRTLTEGQPTLTPKSTAMPRRPEA
jgi:DNA-binding MarR family transcriptional regulator